jgi:chemotaxis family two-component system response regulator Rcp1
VNILLIEDADPDVFLIREVLKRAGLDFQLRLLDDCEKAIDFIEELDRNPGKCPGGQILEHIRQSDRCKAVPVVIITSSDSPRDKAEAFRLGATHYSLKPSRAR